MAVLGATIGRGGALIVLVQGLEGVAEGFQDPPTVSLVILYPWRINTSASACTSLAANFNVPRRKDIGFEEESGVVDESLTDYGEDLEGRD